MRLSANRGSLFSLFAATALSLFLASCASLSLDDTDSSEPTSSAFTQALTRDYQALADSFGTSSTESSPGFFSSPLTYLGITSPQEQSPTEILAKRFAAKAQLAGRGKDVAPEQGTNTAMQMLRARLVQAVDAGKDRFAEDAARAQVDYDCWVLNTGVAGQSAAALQCRTSLNSSLGRLEAELAPAPAPPPVAAAPAAPAAVSTASNDYTVYFDFDSWSLSAQDLAVLTHVIDTARAGGQSRITVVGHTDTSGPDGYNQKLSVRRANVVVEALVDMGARREAITASGVGKHDLAVQTRDGVREAKNRRAVIDLLP